MKLTKKERAVLEGKLGKTAQKAMETLVRYGEALEAERLVEIEWGGHFAIPFALPGVGPSLAMLDELAEAGLRTRLPFTLDPRAPLDFENLSVTREQEGRFREMLRDQPAYDSRMLQLGLRDPDAYTCTPYLPEVGNIPPMGAVLAWSESSCVVFANSVLGARTNRNSTVLDLLSNFLGKTPLTGFLIDAGRLASWVIDVDVSKKPNPQLLGAAIGAAVLEDVPYITGLDRFLKPPSDAESRDFLKEMGAAAASIGAVGLYHVENVTPEALEKGRKLVKPDSRRKVITDSDLDVLFASYPVMWADPKAKPRKCFIGCPHLSLQELRRWEKEIREALAAAGRDRLAVETILCAAPQVIREFKADAEASRSLAASGAKLSGTCPEAYMNNLLCAREAIVTNSNKFRAFTPARMFLDRDLLEVMVTGEIKGGSGDAETL